MLHVKPGQNGLKCVWEGVDIYKICTPPACSFLKKVTQLQPFKYLSNSNLLVFFSATTLQYKQLKTAFYFSNESYNEE